MFRFACLFFLIAVASAGKVNFKDCGNNEVSEIRVAQCDGDHCNLKKGSKVHIEVDFTANEDSKTAKLDLSASAMGITLHHLPGVDEDACSNGHLSCPLTKGTKYTIKYDLTVPMEVPHVTNAHITAKLIGDNSKVLACGTVTGGVN